MTESFTVNCTSRHFGEFIDDKQYMKYGCHGNQKLPNYLFFKSNMTTGILQYCILFKES